MPYKYKEKHKECLREAQRRMRARMRGEDAPVHASVGRPNGDVCRKGHALTEDNITVVDKGNGQVWRCCRQCHLARKQRYALKHNYGIANAEERNALLAAQGNACDICQRTDCTWGVSYNDCWQIDHDHAQQGTHRSILCGTCNLALGRLEAHMLRVIEYLMKWSPAFEKQLRDLLK